MSNIVKLLTKHCISLGITCLAAATFAADDVTPLQLKMMQTRKFMKSPAEVVKALKTTNEDLGGQCNIYPPATGKEPTFAMAGTGQCMFMKNRMNAVNMIPFIGLIKSAADAVDEAKSISQIKFDIESADKGNATIVRMRLFTGAYMDNNQATDPALYDLKFKEVADTMFIEAIPLNHTVQN